jgi:erythromycin esterase
MRLRSLGFLVLVVLSLSLDAAPRRRAAGKGTIYDESTPAGWLSANATVLSTPELVPYTGDLVPLSAMIGSATMVGLGDGTHGTHEFYTVKLRIIDMLVRQYGFDVVGFEAPFPLMNRINAYVQGGAGNSRALLREMLPLGYYMWDAEEMVSVVEWMREYNAHRGDRPPVQIAGFDVLEPYPASREVLAYLRAVDPAAAVAAEEQYKCLPEGAITVSPDCVPAATGIRDSLAGRAAELTALSTATAFQEALQNARVVVQSEFGAGPIRDNNMAQNALWLHDHRGSARKTILWAHEAHLSRTANQLGFEQPMGRTLADTLGSDYFTLATLTATGTFRYFSFQKQAHAFASFAPLQAGAYETYFRQRGAPFLLIPFRGTLPGWLTTPARYNLAGGGGANPVVESLPEHYDAAIFIDATTALHAIGN